MSKEYYKQAKKIFPQFNRETDTVISGRPNPYQKQMAKNIADYNFNRATREGLVDPFGVKQRGYNKNQEGYNYHMLVNKKSDSSPVNIKEEAYERQNRSMRKKHKKETGKTLGERQTSGTGSRRVSFACRFGSMAGSMTDKNGEPSRLAMALKKWGFSSKGEAKSFCSKNKES